MGCMQVKISVAYNVMNPYAVLNKLIQPVFHVCFEIYMPVQDGCCLTYDHRQYVKQHTLRSPSLTAKAPLWTLSPRGCGSQLRLRDFGEVRHAV
jgi:hypothetical protein